MNINRKYIIIFGTLILSLVFITGAVTYYKERKEINITDNLQTGTVISFSQNYPANHKEFSNFVQFCGRALFSDAKALRDKQVKEIVCVIAKTDVTNSFVPVFFSLDSIISFKPDIYISILADLKDVVGKFDPSLLGEDKLYFCSISEPSWTDPFVLEKELRQTLIFSKGDISCAEVSMNKKIFTAFSGFVPQAESLNIRKYLVDEQTVSDVMNKQSFSEIKEILKDHPIIWQMEKPINL